MFKNCIIFCVFFIFTCTIRVNAVEVKGLYQAKVVVKSQTLAQKNIALKKAMQAVLIKVGGEKSILKNKVIKKAINNHRLYVSQFSYVREQMVKLPLDEISLADEFDALFLLASFDEDKINQLLQQAQLPLWGSLRPKVLFWLVEEDNFARQILSESSHSNAPTIVSNLVKKRGLPVILPLMDFTDTTQIAISDLWGRFSSAVIKASARYSSDAVVVIRISNSSLLSESTTKLDCRPLCNSESKGQEFVLDWTLFDSNISHVSEQLYQGRDSDKLLSQALSDITDVIYQGYALSVQKNSELIIDVANIDSMKEYIALTDFLLDLSAVNSVVLLSADGRNRRFRLNLLGSKQTLLSSLRLNNKLNQYTDPLARVVADAVPIFYWGQP